MRQLALRSRRCLPGARLDARRRRAPQGFIAVNGCSLTGGEVVGDTFNVWLIPETLRATTFGQTSAGEVVNLELDSQTVAIVDTVERVLAAR